MHLAILPVALVIITVVKVLVRKNIVAKPEKKKPTTTQKSILRYLLRFIFAEIYP